jgi:hypothetical protein
MDYFSLFFNDELLNNIVVETNSMRDTKFWNFSLVQDPFGVGGLMCWLEMKAFLGLIINMGLMPIT